MTHHVRPEAADAPHHGIPESRYDLRILYAVRRIIRAVDVVSRRLASDHKITGPQLMCLMAVVERKARTATAIAKQVHLSPSTVVGVLDRLEAKGLLRRQRDVEDRRVVHVHATDAGTALVSKTPYPLQRHMDRALKQLAEEDQKHLASCLERLVDLMGAQKVDPGPLLEIAALAGQTQPTESGDTASPA